MNSIRVVVADDHAMVRGAIREILEKVQDIQVVAEAGSGNEALKQVSELACPANELGTVEANMCLRDQEPRLAKLGDLSC